MAGQQIGLKVGGALSGVVFVDSLESTVGTLRNEVARLMGLSAQQGLKLIVSGKTLSDDSKPLNQCGVTPTSRLLVVAGAASSGATQVQQAEQKQAELERIKRVLGRLAGRDKLRSDQYSFSIENQNGVRLELADEDRRALAMGMAAHDMGKTAFGKGQYEEALRLYFMAEESFSLVHSDWLSRIDNLGMLKLDIVWCCYKCGDARRLAVARDRLRGAREALERAYGPGLKRLRDVHGNRCPELAIYTRLEALEAVSAYHCGDLAACEQSLQSAKSRWAALQVSDQQLAQLQDMGYSLSESRRALKLCGNNLDRAVVFIAEEREKAQEQRRKQRSEEQHLKERKRFGRTPDSEWVSWDKLEGLTSVGYDRDLAALALRLHNNDHHAALEDLVDNNARSVLQLMLSVIQCVTQEASASGTAAAASTSAAPAPTISNLKPSKLLTAKAALSLNDLFNNLKQTMMTDANQEDQVLGVIQSRMRELATRKRSRASAITAADLAAALATAVASASAAPPIAPPATAPTTNPSVPPHAAPAAPATGPPPPAAPDAAYDSDEYDDEDGPGGLGGEPVPAEELAMEQEIANALQSDVLSSYDIDVEEEGELISTFSALCASSRAAAAAAST